MSDTPHSSATTPSFKVPTAYLRYVRFLQTIYFPWAASEIQKRFFTPIPFKTPQREEDFLKQAKEEVFPLGDKQITTHTLGHGDKTVVFIHGWSGRGSQGYALAPALVEAGYRFIAITAPAHGNNPGKRTHMLQFVDALEEVNRRFGPIDTILAHSIGGAAAINAVSRGLEVNNLVILGAPSSIPDVIDDFCTRLQLDDRYRRHLENFLVEKYNVDINAFSPREQTRGLKGVRGLIIHDKLDVDVHFEQAEALHSEWPHSELLLTNGLGHRRILSDEDVIQHIVSFLK